MMEALTTEELRECVKKLLEVSKCTVCHEALRSPNIVLCTRGHAVCFSCKLRVTFCAVCRASYCHNKPVSFCEMVEALPRFCRYDYGCNRLLRAGDDHEAWCGFRLLPCLYCKSSVESQALLKHLSDIHSYKPHSMMETDFQRPLFQCGPELQINIGVLKIVNGHMFNVHYLYSLRENALLVYVSLYPTKTLDGTTFSFNLELCSLDNKASFSFSREADLSVNTKIDVFTIPDCVLKCFNGKHVAFRTTISDSEVIEIKTENSQQIIDLSSPEEHSSPISAKKIKMEEL